MAAFIQVDARVVHVADLDATVVEFTHALISIVIKRIIKATVSVLETVASVP